MSGNLQNMQSYRILIADDDPVFQNLAITKLDRKDFSIELASDGAEAMHNLRLKPFDLAIIDLLMPRIDGLRLIPLIRSTPNLRRIPILIITSQCDPSIKVAGMQVGANDFLTKPVQWADLPARLISMIEQQPTTTAA